MKAIVMELGSTASNFFFNKNDGHSSYTGQKNTLVYNLILENNTKDISETTH